MVPLRPGAGDRCFSGPLAFQEGICVSTDPTSPEIPQACVGGEDRGNGSNPILASTSLVPPPAASVQGRTADITATDRPVIPGSGTPPQSREAQSSGMDADRTRLTELGCSSRVIDTLLRSRKPSTNVTYERAWKRFCEFAEVHQFQPRRPPATGILEFLQSGLDLGLSLSTLKGQVSAISAFSGTQWAVDPLISRFFRAVIRLRPPRALPFPKWDLPLVLDLLSSPGFSSELSLWKLTLKTSFLLAMSAASRVSELAALGAEEPFTTFFEDRVVLVPVAGFLPKVVSRFHLGRELVLPRLRVQGQDTADCLDVGSTLKTYLDATAPFRKSERLFIIPAGASKGKSASSRTIAAWLVKTIKMAYEARGQPLPPRIGAHSTRGMAASWAAAGGMSLIDVCKSASWASANTFILHYCLEPASLTSSRFGQVVLSAARRKD